MNYNKLFIYIVCLANASVFLYAGISKLMELDTFYLQLAKSPLIPRGWNNLVGFGVIVSELIITYLLYIKKIKLFLVFSFGLMMLFSLYIAYLLFYSYYIPCSCGGILENMSWESHLIFNLTLTITTAIAYIIHK